MEIRASRIPAQPNSGFLFCVCVVGGQKKGRKQAVALPLEKGKAGRPHQVRKRGSKEGGKGTSAGAPGDTDPGTKTSARNKEEDQGQGRPHVPVPRHPT